MEIDTKIKMNCGKKQYSKKDALTAVNYRTRKGHNQRAEYLRIYQCKFCNYWHITHQEKINK